MDAQRKVIPLADYPVKRVVVPTEIPAACVDVEAFVRSLYEPEILAAIEAVQDETHDD